MSKRKSKKSKNTTLIVFLVITIVLVIALLLYFLLQKRDNFSVKENYQSSKGGNSGDSEDSEDTENTETQTSKGGQQSSCPANIFNDAIDNASQRYDEDVPNDTNSTMICDEGFYPNTRNRFQTKPREFGVKCKNGKVDNYNNTTCIPCDTSDQGEYTKYCGMSLNPKFELTSPIYNTTVENCRKSCNDDQNCGAFSFGENTCYLNKKGDYTLTGISDVGYHPSYHLYIKSGTKVASEQEEQISPSNDMIYSEEDLQWIDSETGNILGPSPHIEGECPNKLPNTAPKKLRELQNERIEECKRKKKIT